MRGEAALRRWGFDRATRWAAGLAVGLIVVFAAVSVLISGRLVYALDDPYIHMAVARNLVGHGVWGVGPEEFASASSSPLWTLVLAGVFAVTGPNDWAALVLNAAAAVLCVRAASGVMGRSHARGKEKFAWLCGVVVMAPLAPVAMTGMEHVAHAAAAIAFVGVAARVLDRGATDQGDYFRSWLAPAMCGLAAVMTGLRFEGLFLAAAVVLVLLVQRRWGLALAVGASAWAPVAAYAWFSTAHGSMWLPNGVAIKGKVGSFSSVGGVMIALAGRWGSEGYLVRASEVFLLVVLAAVAVWKRWRREPGNPGVAGYCAAVFGVGAVLHLGLASLGWFFRYEMYLVALGVTVAAVNARELVRTFGAGGMIARRDVAAVALMLVAGASALVRAEEAHRRVARATREVGMQQVQMARFLARYYEGRAVAANDIGAISWYARVRLLDIWGLGTTETAREKVRGTLDATVIGRLAAARGVEAAVVYDDKLGARGADGTVRPPPGWRKAGAWTIDRNVVVGNREVCFYGTGEGGVQKLAAALREFGPELPRGVEWTVAP